MKVIIGLLSGLFLLVLALRPLDALFFEIPPAPSEAAIPIQEVLSEPDPVKEVPPEDLDFSDEEASEQSPTDMGFAASGWGEGGFSNEGQQSGKAEGSGQRVTVAKALQKTEPAYPSEAKNRGITGYVTLKLAISDKGELTDQVVVASEPAGVFDQSALSAVRTWKFSPAVRDGKRVASFLVQKISFRME